MLIKEVKIKNRAGTDERWFELDKAQEVRVKMSIWGHHTLLISYGAQGYLYDEQRNIIVGTFQRGKESWSADDIIFLPAGRYRIRAYSSGGYASSSVKVYSMLDDEEEAILPDEGEEGRGFPDIDDMQDVINKQPYVFAAVGLFAVLGFAYIRGR